MIWVLIGTNEWETWSNPSYVFFIQLVIDVAGWFLMTRVGFSLVDLVCQPQMAEEKKKKKEKDVELFLL